MTHNAYSFSDIQTYRRCPKRYEYRAVRNLQHKKRQTQLYQGILVHEALMTYYLDRRNGTDEAGKFWGRKFAEARSNPTLFADELADEIKIVEDSEDLVNRYLEQWTDDWEVLHVEEQFFVTLDSGHVISFTPDLVVRDANGFVWIIDHKTTTSLPEPGNVVYADLQAMLYYAGVQVLYPELRGFIFNKLRKKRPTQPKLTKTGKLRVADLDRIDTSYEVLRDFIMENAPQLMDDERHRRRLATLRDQERFFWREQIIIGDSEVETVLAEASYTLAAMQQAYKYAGFARTFQEDRGWGSCSRCEFSRLCQAELLNWNSDQVLAEDYEDRDPKNPYESETQ